MKKINIDDIEVSSKLDNVIENATNKGYSNKRSNIRKKSVLAATLALAFGIGFFGTSFGQEVYGAIKLVAMDIAKEMGINNELEDYTTIINKTMTKGDETLQINDVILDKDEILISATYKGIEKFNDKHSLISADVYINGKLVNEASGGVGTPIDEYTMSEIISVKLNEEVEAEDVDIKIGFKLIDLDNKWQLKFRNDFEVEFTANCKALQEKTNEISLNEEILLENGQKNTLNTYRSNPVKQKIYYKIENSQEGRGYNFELRGYDDLGNEVQFYPSIVERQKGILESMEPVENDAKELKLTAYTVQYPKEGGKMPDRDKYTKVGEEFTIKLK